jgi:hypothetical protein
MARTDMATGEEHEEKGIFWGDVHDNCPATDINNMYNTMKETVLDEFAKYLNNGSSWRLKKGSLSRSVYRQERSIERQ